MCEWFKTAYPCETTVPGWATTVVVVEGVAVEAALAGTVMRTAGSWRMHE